MNKYAKPELSPVRNVGGLSSNENVKPPDEERAEHLRKCNFVEEKKRYCISPGYVLRQIAGEYAIIPVGEKGLITNAVMTPNDSAVFLWKAFLQPSTIEDVVRKGMQEYDAAEETIRNATHRFVEETLKCKILEEVK